MIGWDKPEARDIMEALWNGEWTRHDLVKIAHETQKMIEALDYPMCPECGEPLIALHIHDVKRGMIEVRCIQPDRHLDT